MVDMAASLPNLPFELLTLVYFSLDPTLRPVAVTTYMPTSLTHIHTHTNKLGGLLTPMPLPTPLPQTGLESQESELWPTWTGHLFLAPVTQHRKDSRVKSRLGTAKTHLTSQPTGLAISP